MENGIFVVGSYTTKLGTEARFVVLTTQASVGIPRTLDEPIPGREYAVEFALGYGIKDLSLREANAVVDEVESRLLFRRLPGLMENPAFYVDRFVDSLRKVSDAAPPVPDRNTE